MRGVAIVAPVRTAVGNFGGALRDVPAAELASTVIQAALERSGVDPAKVDDVILGHGYPSGENPAIGRWPDSRRACPSRCRATSWTAAAPRASRPSSTPPCWCRPTTPTW